MHVTHVLIGKSEPISTKSGRSGINKQPQTGPAALDRYGLEGDTIVDTEHHGGLTQAVYIFGQKDYAYWETELGRSLPAGTFGENLVLSDLSTHDVAQGDLFEIGHVTLKATFPRIPCVTLAERMKDKTFPKIFTQSGHVGIYCSVETQGSLSANTDVVHTKNNGPALLSLLPGYKI